MTQWYRKGIGMAFLAAGLCTVPAVSFGNEEGDESETLSAERICQVQAQVPVIFSVGECIDKGSFSEIAVRVNTRTRVSVTGDDFVRFERDCDGRLLETFDAIPAALRVGFLETVHCVDGGAPLEVVEMEDHTWCVNPHRGGYLLRLAARPLAIDICDDAGCYTANVKVTIVALPFEDCEPLPPAE